MALQDLTIRSTRLDTVPVQDPDSGLTYIGYRVDTRQYNTVTKLVGTDTQPYVPVLEGQDPPFYDRATTDELDNFVVPSNPSAPGYDPAHVGEVARVYHNGSGGVSFVYNAATDLRLLGLSSTPTTAVNATDGTITVQLSGSADTKYAALDGGAPQVVPSISDGGALSYTFTGVAPGAHTVTISDDSPAGQSISGDVAVGRFQKQGCRDPAASNYDDEATVDGVCTYVPADPSGILAVSPAGSLRFAIPDSLNPFERVLEADARVLGINVRRKYCQKVLKSDVIRVQFKSNFSLHRVQLRACDNPAYVRTYPAKKVVQGQGNTATFAAYLRAHTNATQARIYFAAATLPAVFAPGSRLTIAGTGTSLDREYPVITIGEDATEGAPYVVINANYAGATTQQRLDCTVSLTYDVQKFDTYEVDLTFGPVPVGCYYLTISATSAELGATRAISEPIELATSHKDTVEIKWRNFDNGFDVNYSFGLQNVVRVVGQFRPIDVDGTDETLLESSGRTTLLSAEARRLLRLKVFGVPDYLHEKLALALKHDLLTVDGLEVVKEGKYERTPSETANLSNGQVVLVQRDWLGGGNSDDLGDINGGGGFILTGGGYIRR